MLISYASDANGPAVSARYLVSRDNDLLDLMDGGRPEGRQFRHRYPGLIIVDPVGFLLEKAAGSEPGT
jgi:hypothetical protein